MATCVDNGWGVGPWGELVWGGAGLTPGGPLPFDETFDIFCAGPCGEMSIFIDYDGVEEVADADQIDIDPSLLDLVMKSGGVVSTDTTRIFVDVGVNATFTLEATFRIDDMPADLNTLATKHIFIGCADAAGGCAGLFFSQVGIAYTGSVQHDGSDNLVINGAVQLLPDSIGLVQQDEYYTVRLVVDANSQTTFVYVTKTLDVPSIGHQLKFVLPTVLSSSCITTPDDGVTISVSGTVAEPSQITIDTLCLGNGLIVPNIPPVADAGTDQGARSCSIVQLDGRASFDPEGANLTYAWRLVDGPLTSTYVYVADDGHTVGAIQTNKFYSATAQSWEDVPTIVAGDVLLLDGVAHTILATGLDGDGFYIQVDGHVLDGGLSGKSFRLIKQNAVSGKTSAQPTFYPDVPGLYKFDLTVNDGGLSSEPASTIVNVTESPVPRGCIPDVTFLWNYISDFWRLVDGTEVIETFWSALAQVAATELLTLWQHEYSKSLRDVQPTFQRRWLHYDLYIEEPALEQTTLRTLRAGLQSTDLLYASPPAFPGATLVLLTPAGEFEVYLTEPEVVTADSIVDILGRRLREVDPRFTVEVLENNAGTGYRLVVRAPFPFTFTAASTATTLFSFPSSNDLPRGTGGGAVGVRGYRVGHSLDGAGVEEGDYLVVDGTAYRIVRVISDPADTWSSQRLVLSEDVPLSIGSDWVICAATRSTYLDFYNSLCSAGDTAIYEVVQKADGALAYFAADVLSAAGDGKTALLTEHNTIAPYLADPDAYAVYFHSVYRRTYMPVDALVVEVPTLQEKIKNEDDTAVLRQNVDFFRTEFRGLPCIRFVTGTPDVWQGELPPKRMWAETTHIDNRPVIEQNFGIPAGFTLDDLAELDDNVDYLSVVRGLWYAYFSGPTLYNLRVGTQILLGLPFAEEAGTIIEIATDFSPSQGRILVRDTNDQAIVRSYTYPRVLPLETNPATNATYAVGDTIKQFSPLVEGAEVVDYVKDPKWFEGYLQQGSFFEVEKFFKFLVRVDSAAFNLSSLLFANQFVKRIKPTYTFPVLVVQNAVGDTTVDVSDEVDYGGRLILYAGPQFGSDGQAQMFDQPRPSGGGFWNEFDQEDPDVEPTYPTATPPDWGFDQYYLAPSESPMSVLRGAMDGTTFPLPGHIFYEGLPLWTRVVATIDDGPRVWVKNAGQAIGLTKTVSGGAAAINKMAFFVRMIAPNNLPLRVEVLHNGVVVETLSVTTPLMTGGSNPPRVYWASDVTINVVDGDTLEARLFHDDVGNFNTYVESLAVVLGEGIDWFPDVIVPAGTYETVLPL